ncbi:ArsR family transcriptional regulator [Actibacterium mucosum KCTC 23349]|uniref:ArsR family transcriptional regulator n=1 Tax=Actibacterium mucosum KCTC 23349 TaxID=1454373 RepID=A0A037ZKY1_9RHOB|nr:ArsR family transcriptional regulator [Actibacterium mucosum KCTC 23349]
MASASLDDFDIKIIKALGQNARISVADLSKQVGLSKTPCHNRIRRLEAEGFITGYRVLLDPVKLDLSHVAFVEVKLSSTRSSALSEFNAAVRDHPEIEQCHMVAAHYDYLLKVRGSDMRAFREFLGGTIAMLPHVQTTSTHVSMEAVKDDAVF